MPDATRALRRRVVIIVTTAAVVVAVAVALALALSGGSGDDTAAPPSSETSGDGPSDAAAGETTLLPEAMGGQAAIDALGDNLRLVAERHDMVVDELRELLLRDDDLRVSRTGALLYGDTMTPPPPATPPAED